MISNLLSRRARVRLFAPVVALALVGAACGGDDDGNAAADTGDETSATSAPSGSTDDGMDAMDMTGASAGPDSAAAELRAGLTSLLQEHVYLAGIATGTALGGGDLEPAAAALDENSVALSEAVGGVYGGEAGDAFLGLWRSHIGMFVDYTTAAASGDEAGKEAAVDDLTGYASDFAAFLSGANPEIDEQTVVDSLGEHVATLTAAIDAQAAKDPTQYAKLRAAAQHMPTTAAYLAGAIASQMPDQFGG